MNQSHASPMMTFDYKSKNIFIDRDQESTPIGSLPSLNQRSFQKPETKDAQSPDSFKKSAPKSPFNFQQLELPMNNQKEQLSGSVFLNDIDLSSRQMPNVSITFEKSDKLKDVWRRNFLIILYFIARFVYLLKIKNKRIRFKFFNKRIFTVFGDISSHFSYYLENDYVYQKTNRKQQLLQRFLQHRIIVFIQDQIKKLSKFVEIFQPDSKFKLVWNTLIALFLVFNVFLMTFEMGFQISYNNWIMDLMFIYFPFLLFSFDILLSFNTAYYKQGKVHFQRKQIFLHYIHNHIFHDIMILVLFILRYYNIIFGIIQIYFLLSKASFLFENIETEWNLREKRSTVLDMTKLIFTIIFVCHFFGCGFHFIGEWEVQNNVNTSWLIKYDYVNKSTYSQYVSSFYWSGITALTVGYGDITPQNETEQLYTLVFILFASMLFGYSISQIGEIFRKMQQKKNELRDQITAINSFLKKKKIDPKLQLQIRKYFEYFFELQLQDKWMNQVQFEHLNLHLKEQFKIDLYKRKLQNSKLISNNLSDKCLEKLCFQIHEQKYTPDDYIFRQGGVNDKIIFLMEGKLQLFCQPNEENTVQLKTITEGQIICETDLFVPSIKQFSCKSINYSTIATLSSEDFFTTIKQFAFDYEKMMMKKDMIQENNYLPIFGESCEICGGAHVLQKCPFLFEQFQQQRIIKEHNFSKDQLRSLNLMKKKKRYKQNCIVELDYIQDKCFQFIIKNDDYLELDLEDINVDDLLGAASRTQNKSDTNTQIAVNFKSMSSIGTYKRKNSELITSKREFPQDELEKVKNLKRKDLERQLSNTRDVISNNREGIDPKESRISSKQDSGLEREEVKEKSMSVERPTHRKSTDKIVTKPPINNPDRPKTRKESRKFSINEQIKATSINKKYSYLHNNDNDDSDEEIKQKKVEVKEEAVVFSPNVNNSNHVVAIPRKPNHKSSMLSSYSQVSKHSVRNIQQMQQMKASIHMREAQGQKAEKKDQDSQGGGRHQTNVTKQTFGTEQAGGQGEDLILPSNTQSYFKGSLEEFEIMKNFDFYHPEYNVENIIQKIKFKKKKLVNNQKTNTFIARKNKTMLKKATLFDINT